MCDNDDRGIMSVKRKLRRRCRVDTYLGSNEPRFLPRNDVHPLQVSPRRHVSTGSDVTGMNSRALSKRSERSLDEAPGSAAHRKLSNPMKATSMMMENKFRRTIDSEDRQSLYNGEFPDDSSRTKSYKKMHKKSASLDVPIGYSGATNPVYAGYPPESPQGGVRLSDLLHQESSPDPNPEGDARSYQKYDIVGLQSTSVYPWQREKGIQCSMSPLDNTHTPREKSHTPQSPREKAHSPQSPHQRSHKLHKHMSLEERTGNTDSPKFVRTHRVLKPCISLDSAKQRPFPVANTRLYHIAERDSGKGLSNSSSSAEEGDSSPRSSKSVGQRSLSSHGENSMTSPDKPINRQTVSNHVSTRSESLRSRDSCYSAQDGDVASCDDNDDDVGGPCLDLLTRNDILSSPPLSPKMYASRCPQVKVTPPRDCNGQIGMDELLAPLIKQRSSESVHSADEDSDTEPSPAMLRRGRRQAIVDSKTLGVITAPDGGETSPTNSCDESEPSNASTSEKRSSVTGERRFTDDMIKVHRKKVLIKRNTVHDFALNKSYQAVFDQDSKRNKMSFVMKLIDKKGNKGKELAELSDVLQTIKPTEFKDQSLISYKTLHWSELIASREKETHGVTDVLGVTESLTDVEKKRREAVWEVFHSECVFLVDHLMVLKHCFMEPLKKVQVEGHLMFAEPQDLFGNLDELCYVSYTFCKDFISLLLKDARGRDFGRTGIVVKALQRYSQLSRDGEVYHEYCLNYTKAINYLEILRKNDKFCEFERWCENDERCHRLQMTDLLISPMQHCTKVPLLLQNITKYTEAPDEKTQLIHSLEKLQTSLNNLEAKMKWLKNFERVQEIQQQIQWQAITDLDPRAYIPEFLKTTLSRQPCERLLASPKRQLLHEGALSLIEISKVVDMYMFLFDDILLLTKIKKPPRKKSDVDKTSQGSRPHTEGAVFVVHKQPIALDRFTVHDVKAPDSSANGMKHAFVLVQISRFQQIIGVYTLQAHSELTKVTWMNKLKEAQEKYKDTTQKQNKSFAHAGSVLVNCDEKADNATLETCLSSVTSDSKNDVVVGKENDVTKTQEKTNEVAVKNATHSSMVDIKPSSGENNNNDVNLRNAVHAPSSGQVTHYGERGHVSGFTLTASNDLFFGGSKTEAKLTSDAKTAQLQKHSPLHAFNVSSTAVESSVRTSGDVMTSPRCPPHDLNLKGIDQDSVDRVKHLVSPTQTSFPRDSPLIKSPKANTMPTKRHVTSKSHMTSSVPISSQNCTTSSTDKTHKRALVDNVNNTQKRTLDDPEWINNTQKRTLEDPGRANKLSRLKAIHESSQSLDVIYI